MLPAAGGAAGHTSADLGSGAGLSAGPTHLQRLIIGAMEIRYVTALQDVRESSTHIQEWRPHGLTRSRSESRRALRNETEIESRVLTSASPET